MFSHQLRSLNTIIDFQILGAKVFHCCILAKGRTQKKNSIIKFLDIKKKPQEINIFCNKKKNG